MNWTGGAVLVLGAVLAAGCGAAEREGGQEGELGEAVQVQREQSAVEGELTALAYCDAVVTWPTAWTAFEDQVLTLVNQNRAAGATCGGVYKPPVAALTLDSRLRCAARKHSKDMGDNNFFSHTGSDGSTPGQRITWAGYTYTAAAENVAAGYSTPSVVVAGWMASPGHCNNIMNGNLQNLGVGYYYRSGSTYSHYWTQNFGRP